MPKDVMYLIDQTAKQFYKTKNKKYFNEFVVHVTPIIKKFIYKTCAGSTWDTDELFSILLADMWRLFNKYKPIKEKKFHWLMLKQLKNKTINYVHQMRGRPHKICNMCGTKQKEKTAVCLKCGAPLRLPDIIVSGTFESARHMHVPNYLDDIANKELVEKLFNEVKDDPKTSQILQMILEGKSKSEISREVQLAQNAMNNRIKKCRTIIDRFTKEKKL